MNQTVKNVAFWLVILLSGVLLWQVVKAGGSANKESEITFSKFLRDVDRGDVNDVTIVGTSEVHGRYKSGGAGFRTTAYGNYPDMIKNLRDKGVNITVKDNSGNGWPPYLLNLSPLILFAALWFVMIRQMQSRASRSSWAAGSWHPATHAPPFSSIEQGGQTASVQSPRLLLANSVGDLALGYCKSHGGEIVFYPDAQIGPVVAWMLVPVLPANLVESQKRS